MTKFEVWVMLILILCIAAAIGFVGWEFYRYNNLKEAEMNFGWGRLKVEDEIKHLTGKEEKHYPKDKHGFFDLSGTAFLQKKVLRLALASGIASWIEKKLLNLCFIAPVQGSAGTL